MQKYSSKILFIKLFVLINVFLLLTACSTIPFSNQSPPSIQDGKYTSRQKFFQVDVPYVTATSNSPITWKTNDVKGYYSVEEYSQPGNFVQFTLNPGYWNEGAYSVDWNPCSGKCFANDTQFYTKITATEQSYLQKILRRNIQPDTLKVSMKKVRIKNHTAIQYIATAQSAKAPVPFIIVHIFPIILIDTVINFDHGIAHVIYMANMENPGTDWKGYNSFLYSLKSL